MACSPGRNGLRGPLLSYVVRHHLKTVRDGARQLLLDTLETLSSEAGELIVVGGWGPYLRNECVHPGTRDVDLLFPAKYTRDDIGRVVEKFLEREYLLSAKHDFQLFRPYQIGKWTYVFNVDLLHPILQRTNRVEFMDVLDLDIAIDGVLVKQVQTMGIEDGQLFFDETLYTESILDGRRFNTLSAAGVVISKLSSCHNPKRPRDIYDIWLSLREHSGVPSELRELMSNHPTLRQLAGSYSTKLRDNWPMYQSFLADRELRLDSQEREFLAKLGGAVGDV